MQWFRSYHNLPTDKHWLAIAKRTGLRVGEVAALYWASLDHASQMEPRGSVHTIDKESLGAFFDIDQASIEDCWDAFCAKGLIEKDRIASWDKKEGIGPSSTFRVQAFRDRKRAELKDLQIKHGVTDDEITRSLDAFNGFARQIGIPEVLRPSLTRKVKLVSFLGEIGGSKNLNRHLDRLLDLANAEIGEEGEMPQVFEDVFRTGASGA